MTARTFLSQHRCVMYLGQPVPYRQNDEWSKNVDVGTISFARGKTKANIARFKAASAVQLHMTSKQSCYLKKVLLLNTETYVWLI